MSAKTNVAAGTGDASVPLRVVIAGGGVAALEAALALRDLAAERVALTIATASRDFVYRPFAVVRPFQPRPTYRIGLDQVARDVGADLLVATARGIDARRRRLLLSGRESVSYDALLIAIGAGAEATLGGGTITPWDWGGGNSFRAILGSLRDGRARSATFIVPTGIVWALPLYELALLTSAFLLEDAIEGVSLTLVTVEKAPLEVFGAEQSARVSELLRERAITLLLDSEIVEIGDGVVRTSSGVAVPSDVTVAVPAIRAHSFSGVPTDEAGFIVTDDYCRVDARGDIFAAGDCTNLPLKQGGVAAQQADTAAAAIAALAGAPVAPAPLRPRLQGLLFTGESSLRLAPGGDAYGDDAAGAAAKLEARHLTQYLRTADPPLPALAT